ncbi:4585_t:CDS:2 [Scutellospora calospora]|uniref:4585_t:CDS:1 n=1 Tax=Scutellospora calospora TaxID=85575 RepID=A0ACA9K3P7_9GLOM|nr:4585_t:CDS:2 [Scutellospora calospora]
MEIEETNQDLQLAPLYETSSSSESKLRKLRTIYKTQPEENILEQLETYKNSTVLPRDFVNKLVQEFKFKPDKKFKNDQDDNVTNTNDQSAFFKFIEGRRFHNIEGVHYPFPNDDDECDRLHLQHFLNKHVWQNNFSSPIAHILKKSSTKVLDIGCGAGSWILEMSTTYQDAKFIGLDITPHQPSKIKPNNLSFVQANALEGLPFNDNEFDFIFQRLLFSGYPESKWPFVVDEMVRVLKPGGYLELTEADPSIKQTGPAGTRLFAGKGGADINACYKLQKYVTEQGNLENIKQEVKNMYHGKQNGRLGEVSIENTMCAMKNLKTQIMNIMQVSSKEYDEIIKIATEEIRELNSYYPMIRVYASKKFETK